MGDDPATGLRLTQAQDHRQASTQKYAAARMHGFNEKYDAVCIQLAGDLLSVADEAL
ncbi:hypothetical protein [Methylobacterium dankookense]|uniref:hypothetical protein n=1 Tax=Methylobacterium dankookense TaxID=560405 RepID=UPI001EDE591F|nr:hypothetical protein [Methylobacterium dankookense]